MKKQYIYIFMVCLSALFSCVRVDESLIGGEQEHVEKISLSIDAVIEKTADTKTALEGSLSDEVMRTVWVPSDTIGVVAWRSEMGNEETVEKFKTNITENADVAEFEGVIASSSEYYALYPYDSSLRSLYGKFVLELPHNQTYVAGSFDPKAAPMVAKADYGKSFEFQNLCGLLALQMTGEDAVKAITFIGKDEAGNAMPLSGTAIVDMSYEGEPVMTFSDPDVLAAPEFGTSVTLNCDTPVQLSETATPFFFALPPATYGSFMIMVHTADGKVMVKEATKPITIERSHVKPTAALKYAETVFVDLSKTGWANSYIVSEAGMYSFDAGVIGNGEAGLIEDAKFHTTDVTINPSKAELVWEDRENLITGVALVNGQVRFYAMGTEGNALIAVKDDADNILWSWHIWITDQPQTHLYLNASGIEYVMLDRNMGATFAERGTTDESWKESMGVNYQWGRKDPFVKDRYSNYNTQFTLEETIHHPDFFATGNDKWTNEWDRELWSPDQKTIYDPCPIGYRVPVMDVWTGFVLDGDSATRLPNMNLADETFDKGWNFYCNEPLSAWYPVTNYIDYWGSNYIEETQGRLWSAENDRDNDWRSRYFSFAYVDEYNCHVKLTEYATDNNGLAVRCMKDEAHEDISTPVLKVTSISAITQETATVNSTVLHEGLSSVKERGIVWGTDPNPTVENSTKVVFGNESGKGGFVINLSGLKHSTRYFVKAYAVNDEGIGYSQVDNFYTPYMGTSIDLSVSGTANSYIVPPMYSTYSFDATVKGNSNEFVGAAVAAEILWETDKYGVVTTSGELIRNMSFENGRISFETKDSGIEGNALIAVKDAEGTVLWSWHIWVTDMPAEHSYENSDGSYIVQDRNLGATRADRGTGDEWKESCGLNYQWGRKDPFAAKGFTEASESFSIESSVANPTLKYNNWEWGPSKYLWSSTEKTMYDPCPSGYRVAPSNIWTGFSMEGVQGSYDNGWHFYYNAREYGWYPNTSWHYPSYIDYGNNAHLTSANRESGLYFYSNSVYRTSINYGALRCMADETHVVVSYPNIAVTAINDITSSSASIVASVDYAGSDEITDRGIIWGMTDELDVNTGTKVQLGSGTGEMTLDLSELAHSTRYYLRAYAVNESGAWYSKVMSFYTPYSGGSIDLSLNGTANCYIVPPVYSSYVFDATVKGNSEESVGTPVDAVVLWETKLNTHVLDIGCVIESVTLEEGKVKFQLPFDPSPGNALIAVRDVDGNILWSWHIWVVDFDPVKTGQTYYSGNMLMDRNLGALTTIPSSGDYAAYGLFYQWGRKDPFTIPDHGTTAPADAITGVYEDLSSIEPTISTPTVVYDQSFWGDDATLWGPVKTIYDPCPPGWRVPDRDVWYRINNSNLVNVNDSYRIIPEPYSVPQAYYPISGVGDGWDPQWTDWFNTHSAWWTSESGIKLWLHTQNDFSISSMEVDIRMSVRCMKEAYYEVVTAGVSDATGTSFIATGEFASIDGTDITEVGFVCSTKDPLTEQDRIQTVASSTGSPFTATITGLKPNTTYSVRAYAKGGYNMKYGEQLEITTGSAGSGEGFGDGGDYDWGEE